MRVKRYAAALMACVFVLGAAAQTVQADVLSNYTYMYDMWGIPVASPDAYSVTSYILGEHLGVGHFRNPQDVHVIGDLIYVVDTGNNRIVIIQYDEAAGSHTAVDVRHYALMNGEPTYFNNPMGIFVTHWGEIWIADTQNFRILYLDADWNVIREITHPEESMLDADMNFLPRKLGVDLSGRMFLQATHVNRGLMEFDMVGDFVGYMGASPVIVSPLDQFWRMIATQDQRARMTLFVPTEYNNVTIDSQGFIWVTNSGPEEEPLRRLNARGDDILIRNGRWDIEGDLIYADVMSFRGRSQFIDVAVLPNNSYVAFDSVRGRLFTYDFQGNLLYVFGGVGNREGTFLIPSAVTNMDFALYALDSQTNALTRFDLTDYGLLINQALEQYRLGFYDESAASWEQVLMKNGNFELAYVGIARAQLRQGYYQEAMRNFRIPDDYLGYGRAFGFFRRQWVEEHFWMFGVAVAVLMVVPPVFRFVRRIRREAMEV